MSGVPGWSVSHYWPEVLHEGNSSKKQWVINALLITPTYHPVRTTRELKVYHKGYQRGSKSIFLNGNVFLAQIRSDYGKIINSKN